MEILLIVPRRGTLYSPFLKKIFHIPSLTAATVASLTPPGHHVTIIDENVEQLSWEKYAKLNIDLVGISVHTQSAPRAYELAGFFRDNDVPVVLGGVHVSALPKEALVYADAVVIGEAEDVWPQVIEDLTRGNNKEIYQSTQYPCLDDRPLPRSDLQRQKSLFNLHAVQTSRGCPHNCTFCAASWFYGPKFRRRPVSKVVDEIRQGKYQYLFFVDEHMTAQEQYAAELFAALKMIKAKWVAQAHMSIANNSVLLDMAKASGCQGLMLGFDSVVDDSLNGVKKMHNQPDSYNLAVRKIQQAGIPVAGAFMLGFDGDDKDVFKITVDAAVEMGVDVAYFFILTPYPGTRLFKEFLQEGRIINQDWSNYDCSHVVFQPKQMSQEQLQRGFEWAWQEFYSLSKVLKRLSRRQSPFVVFPNLFYLLSWRLHAS